MVAIMDIIYWPVCSSSKRGEDGVKEGGGGCCPRNLFYKTATGIMIQSHTFLGPMRTYIVK